MPSDEQPTPANRPTGGHPIDPYAALRYGALRLYLSGNTVSILGMQMQATAVQWEIYERTRSTTALALIGLIQVIPILALAPFAGHVADRFHRKGVVMVALGFMAVTSLGLAIASFLDPVSQAARPSGYPLAGGGAMPWREWGSTIWTMYGLLLLNGAARAFQQPAKSSLLPLLVPRRVFPNAVSWAMCGFQTASAAGPAVAGLAIAATRGAATVYLIEAIVSVAFVGLLVFVRHPTNRRSTDSFSVESLLAGVGFVRRNSVLLGAMILDLFAVLLGGAVVLLPVYAKEILHVGPIELGWLRASDALGALVMSIIAAHRRPFERAGRALLIAVAGFGVTTIIFGFSTSYPLSLVMLFLVGAFDYVSVVVRHTLVQLLTPDAMRGRVSAVNGMFISASNELGSLESGLVASWLGPVFAIVSGGVGTLLVVGAAAILFPPLRRIGRLADTRPQLPTDVLLSDGAAKDGAARADGAAQPTLLSDETEPQEPLGGDRELPV